MLKVKVKKLESECYKMQKVPRGYKMWKENVTKCRKWRLQNVGNKGNKMGERKV